MNEIEEYLLMIFLEDIGYLKQYEKLVSDAYSMNCAELDSLNIVADHWQQFKQEELGRTLPEEFEFFVSDYGFHGIKGGGNMATFMSSKKNEHYKHKIKITVVEE